MEIVEFMSEREPTENERKGRSSGDLSWRTARGEDQQSSNNVTFIDQFLVCSE